RFIFFQAEDGIRYATVTGVQTCALPICPHAQGEGRMILALVDWETGWRAPARRARESFVLHPEHEGRGEEQRPAADQEGEDRLKIGRASCREREYIAMGAV